MTYGTNLPQLEPNNMITFLLDYTPPLLHHMHPLVLANSHRLPTFSEYCLCCNIFNILNAV